jgi:hypothetical protein
MLVREVEEKVTRIQRAAAPSLKDVYYKQGYNQREEEAFFMATSSLQTAASRIP